MKYRLPFPVFFQFLLPVFPFYSLGEHVYSYEEKARRRLGASLVRSDISFAHRERECRMAESAMKYVSGDQ